MDNPYASPAVSPAAAPSQGVISSSVLTPLAATKGWARFLAILGFILAGIMALMGFAIMVMGSTIDSQQMPAFVGVLYIVIGLLYIIPSLKLNSYASRIAELVRNPSEASLVQALDTQRSFWKTVGIMALVTIAIYFLAIILVVAVAASGGMRL